MKKNLQEAKEGNRPEEKPSETSLSAAGDGRNRVVTIIVYVAIVLVVAIIIFYLTRYNADTFKINSVG